MSRYTVLPLVDINVFSKYKKALASFWRVEDIFRDTSKDREEWKKLTPPEQKFIKAVLAFFAGSDGVVNENLDLSFMRDFELKEIKMFYGFQYAIEDIHGETYSRLIDLYVDDPKEKDLMFRAIETMDILKEKTAWMLKWIGKECIEVSDDIRNRVLATGDPVLVEAFSKKKYPLAQRLLAFIIVEGVFFSGSFCAIYWIAEKKILRCLTTSNEYISRDEGLHTDTGILLYHTYADRLPTETVHQMFREAVEIETKFINGALDCRLLGMNSEMMAIYIKYVADTILVQLKYPPIYMVKNPFPFMEKLSVDTRVADFFKSEVTDYAHDTAIDDDDFDTGFL